MIRPPHVRLPTVAACLVSHHASAAGDGTIRLWDRTAYRPLLTLPGNAWRLYFNGNESRVGPVTHDGRAGWYELDWPGALWTLNPPQKSEGARAAAFHRHGFLLAALTGTGAVVWKTAPPSGHSIFIPHERPSALTFTPDGQWLAVSSAGGLHLHAIRRDSKAKLGAPVLQGSRRIMAGAFTDVCFDGAASRIAMVRGDTGTIEARHYDKKAAAAGAVIHTFPGTPATRCAISPDGKWLAAGSPGNLDARVFDLETGNLLLEPHAAREGRNWLSAFSYDNKWLIFSGRTAHLLRTEDWKTRAVDVRPNQGNGRGAVFFRTRNENVMWLAVAGADEEAHVFRVGELPEKLAVLRSPQGGAIGTLAVSAHGTIAAAAPRGEVQLWPLPVVRKHLEKLGLDLDAP